MNNDEWLQLLDDMGCPPRPDDCLDREKWIARGTWILDHDLWGECPSMVDMNYAHSHAIDHWREVVSDCGQCHEDGCCDERREVNRRGETVCKRTRQQCAEQRLCQIVDVWSNLGRRTNE